MNQKQQKKSLNKKYSKMVVLKCHKSDKFENLTEQNFFQKI